MSVTPELAAKIHLAIEVILPPHRRPPTPNELVDSPEAGLERLQDWAFTQGFAVVVESRNKTRIRVECVNHHKETKSWRKTKEEDRVRPKITSLAKDCPYAVYISYRKKQEAWMIGLTCSEHNHPREPDPFQFQQHRHRHPDRSKALMLGGGL